MPVGREIGRGAARSASAEAPSGNGGQRFSGTQQGCVRTSNVMLRGGAYGAGRPEQWEPLQGGGTSRSGDAAWSSAGSNGRSINPECASPAMRT